MEKGGYDNSESEYRSTESICLPRKGVARKEWSWMVPRALIRVNQSRLAEAEIQPGGSEMRDTRGAVGR